MAASSPSEPAVARRLRTGLGVLGVLFYLAHAGASIAIGRWSLAFWVCHLGALAIAIGLLARSPRPLAIGFLWLATGTPLWIVDLFAGTGEFYPTSALTHLGGLLLAIYGMVRFGFPAGSWWRAMAGLAAMGVVARIVTPPAENVNFAHGVWTGYEEVFRSSHALFVLVVVLVTSAYFRLLELGIRRLA